MNKCSELMKNESFAEHLKGIEIEKRSDAHKNYIAITNAGFTAKDPIITAQLKLWTFLIEKIGAMQYMHKMDSGIMSLQRYVPATVAGLLMKLINVDKFKATGCSDLRVFAECLIKVISAKMDKVDGLEEFKNKLSELKLRLDSMGADELAALGKEQGFVSSDEHTLVCTKHVLTFAGSRIVFVARFQA